MKKYSEIQWVVQRNLTSQPDFEGIRNACEKIGVLFVGVDIAEERCKEYTPHDVFVMDVCLCGDEYYIVECGGINGAGFYKANIDNIVNNISEYFISKD